MGSRLRMLPRFLVLIFLTGMISKTTTRIRAELDGSDQRQLEQPLNSTTNNRALSSVGYLPSLFLVGAQKSGSSSLFELLMQHPLILKGTHKEKHFFNIDESYQKGVGYYRTLFVPDGKIDPNAVFMDGTPMMDCIDCWKRIWDTYTKEGATKQRDNLKFIAILREPVSRDLSGYQHGVREELFLGQTFDHINTIREMRLIEGNEMMGAQYLSQLKKIAEVFRRDQILVLSTTALIQNTTYIMERIRRFLDIPEHKSFLRPLPHNDHIQQYVARGGSPALIQCIVKHVPLLDCVEQEFLGQYYLKRNLDLYKWIDETRTKNKNEPKFLSPFEDYRLIPCVEDARREFDALLSAAESRSSSSSSSLFTSSSTSPTSISSSSSSTSRSRMRSLKASAVQETYVKEHMKDRIVDIVYSDGSCRPPE